MGSRQLLLGVFVVFLMIFLSSPTRAEDEKAMSGLNGDEIQKSFDKLKAKWHPIAIKGYAKGKGSRYDITWQKGSPEFFIYWGINEAEFTKHKTRLAKKGFEVTVESSWTANDEKLYAAIWRKK